MKLRLLAALHGASGAGTCLDDVWRAWTTMPPPPPSRARKRGWTAEEMTGLEGYRGLGVRYYLPSFAELRAVFAADFVELDCVGGCRELDGECPTFVLARRN